MTKTVTKGSRLQEGGLNMEEDETTSVSPLPVTEDKGLSALFSGKEPLGFILLASKTLCPFGILPPATEADALGDHKTWKEVRVPPPTWLWGLQEQKAKVICPADFCGENVGKNKSFESHLTKHLSLIISQKSDTRLNNSGLTDLPADVPINYYCNAHNCIYSYTVPDEPRNFVKLKYLKQHFFKVHAPKTFECTSCKKTFATAGLLQGHKRMCGNSFDCAVCPNKYISLEALQTHCRRKEHFYDYNKYREIINIAKQETQARKAAEHLKEKLAAVSLASKPAPIVQNKIKQLPTCIPRPKTVTTCGPGGSTSHVTWTYDNGTETPKLKVEISTQTNSDSESQGVTSETNNHTGKSRTVYTGNQHRKRKKSAETQTGKLRYKISTETQTANVTKRRRGSKKQNAEAETQCTLLAPIVPPEFFDVEGSGAIKTDSYTSTAADYSNSSAATDSSGSTEMMTGSTISNHQELPSISLAALISCVGIDNQEGSGYVADEAMMTEYPELAGYSLNGGLNFEPMLPTMTTATITTSTVEAAVATSEMCVGNRFDEVEQRLFDFEEFNQETQTDSNLFHPWSNYTLSDFDMEVNDEVDPSWKTNLLNLVTAETQTWPGISPPRAGVTESCTLSSTSTSTNSGFQVVEVVVPGAGGGEEDWNIVSRRESLAPFEMPVLSPIEYNPNSPSFLETMDNETQTSSLVDGGGGYDFDALLQNMMSNQH